MADKMNNINTPGGDIQVPAWASEETMNRVVAYMSAQNKTDRDLNKIMAKVGGNINELQRELSGLLTTVAADNTQDQQQEAASEKFSEQLVKNSAGLMKTAGFFGNTEKPLTAIVNAGAALTKGAKDSSGGLKMFKGMMNSSNLYMNALGTAGNVAIDGLLAYAGWNAGKIEQFADAQSKIIDAGVVFNGGAEAFDELRKRTLSTGVTYTSLIDNIHSFGDGMLGLGGTMSEGVNNFSKFYAALDEQVENFGDLGLSSKDMMSQYGEFLTYARRTGMVNSNLNNSAENVNQSFIDLQIEAGAVASLTSLTKAEAMRRSLQSFDEFGEAALISMEKQGLTGAAEVTRQLIKDIGKMAPDDEHMKLILDAIQQEAFEKSENLGAFDISGRLQEGLKGAETAIENVYPGFIENIENMMRSGDMSSNEVTDYIFGALNSADLEKYSTFNAAGNTVAGQTQTIQANAIKHIRVFGNLAKPGALAEEKTKLKTNLKAAGKVTMEMNHMTRRFLEVQETFTMDMETVAGMFNGVYELFGKSSKKLTSLAALKEQETNDFGGIGADINDATVAITGGVGVTPEYDATSIAIDLEKDNEKTKNAKIANQSVETLTAADLEGFTQLYNKENTLQKLNSLAPQARMRMLGVIKDFDAKYAGTETKMSVTSGMKYNTDANAPETWETSGNQANILLIEGDEIITNDETGIYSNDLGKILTNNNMTNESGQGSGVATVVESKTSNYNTFKAGDTSGQVTEREIPQMKQGGPVDSGQPYVVGDQMGLDTAELFVPSSRGTILSNTEIMQALMPEMTKKMNGSKAMQHATGMSSPIQAKLLELIGKNLTNPEISSKINNSQELTEIINSKRHTIEALIALRTIVKRLNNKYKLDIDIDMMNSR
jgi:hypothetical protein